MAQLEGRYHAQTKVLQILRHILSLGSRAVTSTPVSMAVIPVQNNYRTIITLAAHTFPRRCVWFRFGSGPLYIPSGPAMGSLPSAGSSVLLASHPTQPRKYNSAICGSVSFKSFSMEDLSRVHLLQVHCHGNPEALCPC